ncbi:STAS domain-containing protein [Streptomyces antimicrobicus]|uniref:STAS domain-containing protein n=1 Tax=Streptomyces antimicrobicus TaxID=2883108 RepID=UPI0021F6949E|nr:STAS domain-containing protein [Streptomyces antimicrobicus]
MDISVRREGPDRAAVQVSGEVDVSRAPELRRTLLAAVDACPGGISLDVMMATFRDCSGLNALLDVDRAAAERHRPLKITAAPAVQRLLTVAGAGAGPEAPAGTGTASGSGPGTPAGTGTGMGTGTGTGTAAGSGPSAGGDAGAFAGAGSTDRRPADRHPAGRDPVERAERGPAAAAGPALPEHRAGRHFAVRKVRLELPGAEDGRCVVFLEGLVEPSDASAFRNALAGADPGEPAYVVELSGLDLMTPTALTVLTDLGRTLAGRGRRLVLTGHRRLTDPVVQHSRSAGVVEVHATLDRALVSAAPRPPGPRPRGEPAGEAGQ